MHEYLFLKPLDVLYLRGNRLFGAAGDHSEALMPPWPSVAAGAIRTRILADCLPAGISMKQYGSGTSPGGPLGECLGTPQEPGAFEIVHFSVGRMTTGGPAECFLPMPADALVQELEPDTCRYLLPRRLGWGILSGYLLDSLPVLRTPAQGKMRTGLMLNPQGLTAYLEGAAIRREHLTETKDLWQSETRLGIALSALTRSAEGGRIYTSMVVAMKKDAGFVVGVAGAGDFLPKSGLLRFGGDGRAVEISPCSVPVPEPPWDVLQQTGQFRVIFQTPGLFPDGWRLPGFERENGGWRWVCDDFQARLAAVALPRSEVISGWDMALSLPKPALKSVPAGSVYWFEDFRGEIVALKRLLSNGVQTKQKGIFCQRQAEGFNRVLVGAWPEKTR